MLPNLQPLKLSGLAMKSRVAQTDALESRFSVRILVNPRGAVQRDAPRPDRRRLALTRIRGVSTVDTQRLTRAEATSLMTDPE